VYILPEFFRFQMINHSRILQDSLLAEGYNAEDELEMIQSRQHQLSQKDHWENNGVLNAIMDWSQEGRDGLLWVGGSSGNQDTWVTELSADTITALQPQLVTVLFVFCTERGSQPITPLGLVRRLIVQLLDKHPELAYRNPEICSLSKFQKSASFGPTWRIFEALALGVQNLFLVIDRIEECEADEQADLVHQLLPRLIDFGRRNENASIIVTSVFNPPDEISELLLYASYIDTGKRASRRE
jgi:hypothetical protein